MNKHGILAAMAGAAMLAGCAGGPHETYVSAGYGYGPDYYDVGYYDGFYGPAYDGYWASDGFFYYTDGNGHPWRRDEGHHFRHDSYQGYNQFHGRGMGHGPVAHGHAPPPPRIEHH